MKKIAAFLGALSSLMPVAMSQAQQQPWPPLSSRGFISGRAATVQDVDQGNAVFVAKVGGDAIGKPIDVPIPQYAFWIDERGKRIPVIVVQAEEARGKQLFAFRDMEGQEHVCTGPELTLLGTVPPN